MSTALTTAQRAELGALLIARMATLEEEIAAQEGADGRVAAVRMDDLPGFETAWRDDCPHPVYCLRYAAAKRWLWDETSLDAVYGRFARRLTTVDWGEGDPDGQKA